MDERLEAVQRMQDYIEEHLDEMITQADLARASLFSPWYSYRLFKEYTHYTPADYIRRLRLSRSALRLRDEDCRIVTIAYDMGFQSVDGYQRAFFREFGCNPSEYAKHPVPLPLFIPFGVIYMEIRKEYTEMEQVKNVFIQRIHKDSRKVVIKRGIKADDYFSYGEEVGCDVWGLLTSMCSGDKEPVSMWLPKQYRKPNTSEYVQGVEMPFDFNGEIPEGMDIIELPSADYLMFQGEPFLERDYCKAIDEVQASIMRYNPAVIGCAWDLSNPRIQLEPRGERGYIELHPII